MISSATHTATALNSNLKLPQYAALKYQLPTALSTKDKHALVAISNSRCLSYTGQGKTDSDAASCRTNYSIPPQVGMYYFEVTIKSKGRDGYIGIGFSGSSVLLSRLPGWDPNSWGYHGDDGHTFNSSGQGKPFGPSYTTGDVIGCGINFLDSSAFYTKNGVFLGVAFKNLKNIPLFPCVGLRTPGEVIECNFGESGTFVFDFEQYFKDEKLKLLSYITGIEDEQELHCDHLILEYMIHAGYSETAKCMRSVIDDVEKAGEKIGRDIKKVIQQSNDWEQDIAERKAIKNAIHSSQIQTAIQKLTQYYPSVLTIRPDISFQLKIALFIEKIKKQYGKGFANFKNPEWLEIIAFGQEIMQFYGNSSEYQDDMIQAFSLIAYEDPYHCPNAHLLNESCLEHVAELVNGAILESQGKPSHSAIEGFYNQTVVVKNQLAIEGSGCGSFINEDDFFL